MLKLFLLPLLKTMLSKADYIKEMRAIEEQARKDGYSEAEIQKAYEIAHIMKVSYLSSYSLERGREELQNELLAEMSGERNLRKESNNLKIFTGQTISYQEFNQDIANEESQLQDELSRTL